MAELINTIAVVNKSGKVVSTSKHLMSVFKEAKNAYRERKAEIVSDRQGRVEEKQARKGIEAMRIGGETDSNHSRRDHTRSHRQGSHLQDSRRGPELRVRPPTERYHSGSSVRSSTSTRSASSSPRHHSSRRGPPPSSSRTAPSSPSRPKTELARRHTTQDLELAHPPRRSPVRSHSASGIDMDLAYGEFHPKSIQHYPSETNELPSLVTKVKKLLDEADCAHASVTAIIAHLQKNPEAMAAVALTLAEISNVASKMAPGALTALRASAPAVFALLASPQFLIAAGVGVGITIVMLGGYKVIKKIQAKNNKNKGEGSMDEMVEIADIDRIDNWRRGIALPSSEMEGSVVDSAATSVEGEFITPVAAGMRSREAMAMPMASGPSATSASRSSRMKSRLGRNKTKSEKNGSERSGGGRVKSDDSGKGKGKGKEVVKVKKPSPLRMMFK